MINRSAVIVRAREPFVEWVNGLPDPAGVTLEEVNQDPSVYLLPEWGLDAERQTILEAFCDLLFDLELEGWWVEEADWPAERDLATFLEWFDVDWFSQVLDLTDEPLIDED